MRKQKLLTVLDIEARPNKLKYTYPYYKDELVGVIKGVEGETAQNILIEVVNAYMRKGWYVVSIDLNARVFLLEK